ncbi:MAG: DUF58 domain-containing protein [Oscillospiraceae bacterium]|nr:DUF58 domain-containing protein [Oscillospiraceae bacterium]
MRERRICYLVSLFACLVFYFVYQQWFSWLLLLTMMLLPWFSLAISYPAMRTVTVTVSCPEMARMDMPIRTAIQKNCRFPMPPVDCKIRLVNSLTGERYIGEPGEKVPTDHCGKITITTPDPKVYDYLGLFSRSLPPCRLCTVFVLPKPVEGELLPESGLNDSVWRPKPGGGVAERHELRLYRPGDELRNIHWKMTAKTGKLIYREAMEQTKKGYVLTLALSGTPEQLDKKLGQLFWSSRTLIAQRRPHRVRCLTGGGTVSFSVTNENSLEEGMRKILMMPCATKNVLPEAEDALWLQTIGGDGNG